MEPNTMTSLDVDCGFPVGRLRVYVQRPTDGEQGLCMLNVPDLGCTYHVVQRFYHHLSMEAFNNRTTWIHVIPPGQDVGDEDLPDGYHFPTFQELGEALVKVLDVLGVKCVVCFGEGAGANILARFALKFHERVSGMVLIHCIGTSAQFFSSIRERLAAVNMDVGISSGAESFLTVYHFGKYGSDTEFEDVRGAMYDFRDRLYKDLNSKNLKAYVTAHIGRSDITDAMCNMTIPTMIVIGDNAYQSKAAKSFYQTIMERIGDRRTVELIEVRGVANVLEAAQERLADSLLLFVQGIGLLSSVLGRQRSASVRLGRSSMQEADNPTGFYAQRTLSNASQVSRSSGADSILYNPNPEPAMSDYYRRMSIPAT